MLDFAFKKMKLVMRAGWGLQLEDGYEIQVRTEVRKECSLQQQQHLMPIDYLMCVCGRGVGG